MSGFANHDVSAAESGCHASFVGRSFEGCAIPWKGSGRPWLGLLAAGAVMAAGAALPAVRGGQPSFGVGEFVDGAGDRGGAPTFESVLLYSSAGSPSESVIADDASPRDGFLATDETNECPPVPGVPSDGVTFGEGLKMLCPGLCRGGCSPRWSVQVDALMLWRSNMQSVPLFVDLASGATLDANQVQPPMSAGPRVGVVRQIGPCTAIEGNYFNVSPFGGQAVTPAAGGPFTMTNFGDLVFDEITTATLMSSARIQSAELNWRRSIGPAITWLSGFRWVQWNEQMTAAYQFSNSNPYNLGSGSVAAATGNDLYGGQIGLDALLWDRGGRWKVNGLGKAGVFYNHAYQNSSGGWVPLPGSGDPYTLPTVSASANKVAFVGEVGVNSTYWLTPWLGWRAGYSLLWLSGVAVAPEQFPLADYGAGTTMINTSGSVFLHGVTTGLEARW
jgi:hypothetical protein